MAETRTVVKKVLDLSVHNGALTDAACETIKAKGMGVILRIGYTGYGSLAPAKDTVFENNIAKLKKAGVPVGAYYFTIAFNKAMADKEISFIKSILKEYKWELPFYLDVEGQKNSKPWTNLSGSDRASFSAYILQAIEDSGYYVGIYSSKHGFTSSWLDMTKLTSFDKWVAQYNSKCTYTGSYNMWQYSSKEKAKQYGLTKGTYVDINNAYVDFESIIKKKGLNGWGETSEDENIILCPNCGCKIHLEE
jgi:GH25 family lysozyme M1 (1,4-beta-N-acetylmuramidase)